MANRKTIFAIDEYYHIFNRGVDKRIIFADDYDIRRFFKSMIEFNTIDPIGSLYLNSFNRLRGETPKSAEKLIDIIAYCLNSNHFHLILKQSVEGGISEYMKRLGGYTSYFNNKYDRSGSLFQGTFKSVHVDSNEYLLHVSAYINLNDRAHQLGDKISKLVESISSWGEYTNTGIKGICEKEIILDQFENVDDYKEFALSSLESIVQRKNELEDLDKLLLEN